MNHIRCTNSYSDVTAETKDYIPGWIPVTSVHEYNTSAAWNFTSRLERAFLYTSSTEDEYPIGGKITTYPSGGYVADLTEHADQASSLIQDLEANHWIDQYTRAVLVEFNVLNPNSKLFNQVILVFEYTADGGTLWTTNVNVVQLYRYAGSAGVVALLSEIACGIFVLVITVLEVIKIWRMHLRYFREVWNLLLSGTRFALSGTCYCLELASLWNTLLSGTCFCGWQSSSSTSLRLCTQREVCTRPRSLKSS